MECRSVGTLPVVEKFVSVNGEGLASGRLAAFIRFAGCNLDCAYCDTQWANGSSAQDEAQHMSVHEIVEWVRRSDVSAVTLTGGEPLLQPELPVLADALLAVEDPHPLRVEIETNGSCDLLPYVELRNAAQEKGCPGSLHLTVDWKTPCAGNAAGAMMEKNFSMLDRRDAVKFVVGSVDDVVFAKKHADAAELWGRTEVLLSPVWGSISPADIVDAMKMYGMDKARLQLQLHKLIWPDVQKGV